MLHALPSGLLGTQLDERYRLDQLIGEGATAWVFAGHDARLARDVAIKVLKPQESSRQVDLQGRFVLEGRTLARFVHPNVVPIYDAGVTREGFGFLVMELCQAGTLEAELFRRKVLGPQEAVELLLPLLGALACAHDRGIVHRDIKPANIVLTSEYGQRCAKLLDFGIAKRADSASTDSASGTPSYMAPEQAGGKRPSSAADVWSMGVVFFRCLSGSLPFVGETHLAALQKLVNERAPRFADACPGLGGYLAIALDRALERSPERRYHDMRSFAQALAAACVQDGIALSTHTESLGLARTGAGQAQGIVEATRPLGDLGRAIAAARPFWQAPRRELRLGAWLAATLAVLALVVAWVSPARDTIRQPPIVRAQARTLAASPASPAVAQPLRARGQQSALTPLPGAVSAAHDPSPQPVSPAPGAKRFGPARRARVVKAPPPQPTSAPPAQPVTSSSALVTDWNW